MNSHNSGTRVYATCTLDLIDTMPGFFRKLKEFVGEFIIEGKTRNFRNDCIDISFWTDVVEFNEGEERRVNLEAMRLHDGNWKFTKLIKV